MKGLTIIVLTFNEAIHISRCLQSALQVASEVIVVDAGSTDGTQDLASQAGARLLRHDWVNHATQLNWAIDNGGISTDWVMRLDADEYMDGQLTREIAHNIAVVPEGVTGFVLRRVLIFQDKKIRFGGGVSPGRVLRLWRHGGARCEQRWMDEHIVLLSGRSILLKGTLYDHSLKTLTWWIEKHNRYANREAVDLLNQKYGFLSGEVAPGKLVSTVKIKRLIKNRVYRRTPSGLRAVLYFIYRVVFRLGLFDGWRGMRFHFLQALWYRSLVDMKVTETERYMCSNRVDVRAAIRRVLDINVSGEPDSADGSSRHPVAPR